MEIKEDIGSKVLSIISEYLGEEVTPETVLADRGADSIDLIEIAVHIEDDMNIDINDEQLETVRTAQDFIAIASATQP